MFAVFLSLFVHHNYIAFIIVITLISIKEVYLYYLNLLQAPAIRIVASLDFGYSYTGIAFVPLKFSSTSNNAEHLSYATTSLEDIVTLQTWPSESYKSCPSSKVPTCLFYRSINDVTPLWGHEAVHASMISKHAPWQFQNRIKSRLFHGDIDLPHLNIPPLPKHRTAAQIVTDFLTCVLQYFLSVLNKNTSDDIYTAYNILWSFGVSETWDSRHKDVFQACAIDSGFIVGDESSVLSHNWQVFDAD